jgi:hypothetical protein
MLVPQVLRRPFGRRELHAIRFTFAEDKVTQIEVIADPLRLSQLELSVLDVGR